MSSSDIGRRGAATVITAVAAVLAAAPTALAGDADATAVVPAVAPDGVFVAGSATFTDDTRSAAAGRWNAGRGAFDWLWRVDIAPGGIDGFTDLVRSHGALYGIGFANGKLAVAKFDETTGTLLRSCADTGVATHALDAPVLTGRAIAIGGDIVVVGGTLVKPTRGVIAVVDGATCALKASALVGGASPAADVGFTALDQDDDGNLIVSGFVGTDAQVLRFAPNLDRLGAATFDHGAPLGDVFTDVNVDGQRVLAVGGAVVQCLTLPSFEPDSGCGEGGRRPLTFDAAGVSAGGVVAARLPSGSWLLGGSNYGFAGFPTILTRAALAAFVSPTIEPDTDVLAPDGQEVYDAFPYQPSSFADLTASSSGVTGAGVSGYFPIRVPFLFSSSLDGTSSRFTPLTGFATAAPAPREPAPPGPPPAPPAASAPAATPPAVARPARLATGRFKASRPAPNGKFGTLTLTCARACTARGDYRVGYSGVGTTTARLRTGQTRRLGLRLSPAGRRRLARSGRLRVTVRFVVKDAAGTAQRFRKRLTLRVSRAA